MIAQNVNILQIITKVAMTEIKIRKQAIRNRNSKLTILMIKAILFNARNIYIMLFKSFFNFSYLSKIKSKFQILWAKNIELLKDEYHIRMKSFFRLQISKYKWQFSSTYLGNENWWFIGILNFRTKLNIDSSFLFLCFRCIEFYSCFTLTTTF